MPGLGLILDISIILLLGATIFYAIRLSRHLDVFRSNRSEMERLIRELSMQITRAQEGVTNLDDAAKESGDELQALITKARGLTEELTLMTEAGNALATRLEGLATKNRSIVDELGHSLPPSKLAEPLRATRPRPVPPAKATKDDTAIASPFFSIRDPDFDSDEKDGPMEQGIDNTRPDLESQAEKDLAAALRRKKLRDTP